MRRPDSREPLWELPAALLLLDCSESESESVDVCVLGVRGGIHLRKPALGVVDLQGEAQGSEEGRNEGEVGSEKASRVWMPS